MADITSGLMAAAGAAGGGSFEPGDYLIATSLGPTTNRRQIVLFSTIGGTLSLVTTYTPLGTTTTNGQGYFALNSDSTRSVCGWRNSTAGAHTLMTFDLDLNAGSITYVSSRRPITSPSTANYQPFLWFMDDDNIFYDPILDGTQFTYHMDADGEFTAPGGPLTSNFNSRWPPVFGGDDPSTFFLSSSLGPSNSPFTSTIQRYNWDGSAFNAEGSYSVSGTGAWTFQPYAANSDGSYLVAGYSSLAKYVNVLASSSSSTSLSSTYTITYSGVGYPGAATFMGDGYVIIEEWNTIPPRGHIFSFSAGTLSYVSIYSFAGGSGSTPLATITRKSETRSDGSIYYVVSKTTELLLYSFSGGTLTYVASYSTATYHTWYGMQFNRSILPE